VALKVGLIRNLQLGPLDTGYGGFDDNALYKFTFYI